MSRMRENPIGNVEGSTVIPFEVSSSSCGSSLVRADPLFTVTAGSGAFHEGINFSSASTTVLQTGTDEPLRAATAGNEPGKDDLD